MSALDDDHDDAPEAVKRARELIARVDAMPPLDIEGMRERQREREFEDMRSGREPGAIHTRELQARETRFATYETTTRPAPARRPPSSRAPDRNEIASVRKEIRALSDAVGTVLGNHINKLRNEMRGEMAERDATIADLRREVSTLTALVNAKNGVRV